MSSLVALGPARDEVVVAQDAERLRRHGSVEGEPWGVEIGVAVEPLEGVGEGIGPGDGGHVGSLNIIPAAERR